MKKILPLILWLICCIGFKDLQAQTLDCKKFKNGKFKMIYGGKTDIITRSGTQQTEVMDQTKITATYLVKWIDDCTYTLTPTAATSIRYPMMPRNIVLTVKITKTSKSSYTQTTTGNLTKQVVTGEMIKID